MAKFQKGHKLAKGGARPGSGRDSDWLRDKCRALVEKHKLIEFVAAVASGEYVQNVVSPTGEKLAMKVSAEVKDRLRATEMLNDRGWGKAPQALDVKGSGPGGNFVIIATEK